MIGAGDSGSLFGLPGINSTVPVCSTPCGPSDLAGFALGLTGIIDGVYVVVTCEPFVSSPRTVTGTTSPAYGTAGSGVNVTSPVSLFNVYLPITLPSGLLASTSSLG